MKKLFSIGLLLMIAIVMTAQSFVVYCSDDPYSSAAAAIIGQKYGVNSYLDVAESDSTAQATWYTALTDSSYTYGFVVADTVRPYTADYLLGQYVDSLDAKLLNDSDTINFWVGTDDVSKCEMAWDSLYTGITPPLIIAYLSEGDIYLDKGDASGGASDSTELYKANTTGWTDSTWIGNYIAITLGPAMGDVEAITDLKALASGDADTIVVAGFAAAITSSSDFTIIPSNAYPKWLWYDRYAYYGVLGNLADVEVYRKNWRKLLNKNGKLNNMTSGSGRSPAQDRDYLDTVLESGQAIFEYLVEVN